MNTIVLAALLLAAPPVDEINVEGLKRTSDKVVERELLIREGDPLDQDKLDESVQRLKNLEIFSRVEAEVRAGDSGDGPVAVNLSLQEKWTTIPVFRIGSGGGIFYLIVGAYDVNLFGRFLEAGAQYENLGGTHSGVIWFRNPRFLGRSLRVGVDLWDATRVRSLYADGQLQGAFTLRRQRINSFVDQKRGARLTIGAGLEVNRDQFSNNSQTPEQLAANTANGLALPRSGQNAIARVTATYGEIDIDQFNVVGREVSATVEHAPNLPFNDFPFTRAVVEGRAYWLLPWHSNLATRLTLGTTTTDAIQEQFYIGGIEYTRGLLDGQARGSHFWQANLEYRIPSVRSDWFVLQHVFFTDIGNIQDSGADLIDMANVICTSTGVGVRLISPRIYRAVLRIDYAFAFGPHEEMGISFGVQQFF